MTVRCSSTRIRHRHCHRRFGRRRRYLLIAAEHLARLIVAILVLIFSYDRVDVLIGFSVTLVKAAAAEAFGPSQVAGQGVLRAPACCPPVLYLGPSNH